MTTALRPRQRAFVNQIAERLTDDDLDQVMRVLRDGMQATTTVRNSRGASGQIDYAEKPDHQIRLAAASMLISATQQKPSVKQEVEVKQVLETPEQTKAKLLENLDSCMRIMSEMSALRKRQPIDVTPGSPELRES